MKNPFIFGQVLPRDAAYCARPELERAITETIENRQRLVLLGDRRTGKSTVVERTLTRTDTSLFVTIDLLGVTSVPDLIERIRSRLDDVLGRARTVARRLPPAVLDAFEAISSLKIHVPFLEVEAHPGHATTINAIMDHIQRVSVWRPLTIFFDEFQEIADQLDEKDSYRVLGTLRAAIQRQPRITYLFAGSAKDSLSDIFTASSSPFFKTARLVEIRSIPRIEMERFLTGQFRLGGRLLDKAAVDAIFLLAGDNPSDLQELSYHIWARSEPGRVGREQIKDGFSTLMHEVGKAGERILAEATPSQRRSLFALALRAGQLDVFTAEFLAFSGFGKVQSVARAISAFTEGKLAILEKRSGHVQFRDRFMRLWILSRIWRNPSVFPPAMDFTSEWLQSVRPLVAPTSIALAPPPR